MGMFFRGGFPGRVGAFREQQLAGTLVAAQYVCDWMIITPTSRLQRLRECMWRMAINKL